MRVHAKCSLGLFVELSVTFLWKQTCFNQHIFSHIFPCWQQVLYVRVMIMAWCAVCRIAMALPVNIAQMKYSVSLSLLWSIDAIKYLFFMFVFLSDDPLTAPDMLALSTFFTPLFGLVDVLLCLSGRSETSCIDVNCWCLIFRVKNSIAPRVPLKINSIQGVWCQDTSASCDAYN